MPQTLNQTSHQRGEYQVSFWNLLQVPVTVWTFNLEPQSPSTNEMAWWVRGSMCKGKEPGVHP